MNNVPIYSLEIMQIAANMPDCERLQNPDASVRKTAPICGSVIEVDIKVKDGYISAFGQKINACVLGQAAASVVAKNIIGSSFEEMRQLRLDMEAMLKKKGKAPRFDAAGLITAITCEAGSNQILMVAHMNKQALELTLKTGIVHYYSRSRAALWKKGETSGEIQKLLEMRTDCDQDVLHFLVEQTGRGAACHTGRKSCFYRQVVIKNDAVLLKCDAEPPLFDPAKVYKK